MSASPLKGCCREEASRSLRRHRDIATCDECGRLLLAYGDDRDFHSTVEELERHRVSFETGESGALKIVAKARPRPAS